MGNALWGPESRLSEEAEEEEAPDEQKYCTVDSSDLTRHQAQKVCTHLRGDSTLSCTGTTARLRKTAERLCKSSTRWPSEKQVDLLLSTNYKPKLTGDVLVVMIGKMPDETEMMQHWFDFLKTADSSLYIACHPQTLESAGSLEAMWSPHLEPGHFLIVDEAHHLPTTWGNISLALATLMTIQFALIQRKAIDAFQKIVFIQQDVPLYPYDVMKRELCSDSRSWFKVRDGAYPTFPFYWPYNFNRSRDIGAGIDDHNWASAIFALDVRHIRIFFGTPRTYVKGESFNCGSSDGIGVKSLFPEFEHVFDQVSGSWNASLREKYSDDFSENPVPSVGCMNQDEYLFITRFKEMFPDNRFNDEVRTLSPKTAELLKYRWMPTRRKHIVSALPRSHRVLHAMYSSLKYDVDFDRVKNSVLVRFTTLAELRRSRIYMPRVVWWNRMMHDDALQSGYTGLPICFNPDNLKSRYNKVGCTEKGPKHYVYDNLYGEAPETCVLNNGRLQNITDFRREYAHERLIEDDTSISIKDDKESYRCGEKIAQSLSYTDWSSFSIHPENLFRSAHLSGGDTAELFANMKRMSTSDFLSYLKNTPGDLIMSIQDGYKQMYWHPTEYFTIDARVLANAFNTLIYFRKNTGEGGIAETMPATIYRSSAHHYDNDQEFAHSPTVKEMTNCALLVWQLSLEKLRNFANVAEEGYFVLDDQAEQVPVGSFLTSNIISSALATGCLFMRKLVRGSGIGMFSEKLLLQKEYVPRRSTQKVPIRDDFDTDALFVPRIFK